MPLPPPPTPLFSIFDILTYTIIGAAFCVAAGYIAYKLFSGVDKITGEATKEETEFERAQLAVLPAPPMVASLRHVVPAAGIGENFGQPIPPPPPPPGEVPASTTDPRSIAEKLAALGILGDLQGRIPMSLPPDGVIYSLRRGGSCGILPRAESAEVMEHFCRRFDMVIFPSPSGELLVIERFQGRLPSLLNMGGNT